MLSSARVQERLARRTLALVLAGGRGSRLKQLTDRRAKPAVFFGGKFRIIDFALSNCLNSNIRRIAVLTQYKAHSLLRHLQMGWSFLRPEMNEFLDLLPAQQRLDEATWYRGTADAVYQNFDILRAARPEFFVVLAGDHVYKMDYSNMLADMQARGADCIVACVEVPLAEASGFGVIAIDAYWAANLDLVTPTPSLDIYDPNWPVWTYQQQLPPAKFIFDDDDRRGMAVDSMVSGGCIISGAQVKSSLLFSSVRVNSYAQTCEAVLLPEVQVGRNARLNKVVVDRGCRIPENLVIGEDPELDAKRFYRSEGGVALISADMLDAL